MKNIFKLIILALSVALLLGALTVAVLATDSQTDETATYAFTYKSGGVDAYTDDIATALSGADAESTVILNKDFLIQGIDKGFATVDKKLTLDLNDHTLTVEQTGEACIYVEAEFTVQNGALQVYSIADKADGTGTTYIDRSYPLFFYNKSNVKITLDNVDTYAGCVVFSWGKNDIELYVNGGTHDLTNKARGVTSGGIVETRASITFEAKGATFILDSDSYLLTDMNFKDTNAATTSSYLFENCKILLDGAKTNSIIEYANVNTTITFNGCDILGSINPALNVSDTVEAIDAGSIIIGEGTRYSAAYTHIGGSVIVAADGMNLITTPDETVGYTVVIGTTDKPSTDGTGFAPAEKTLTAEYSVVVSTDTAPFEYTYGDETRYASTFAAAMNNVEENGTVTMLEDVTLTESSQAFLTVKKNTTLNLGGHTLEVVQRYLDDTDNTTKGEASIVTASGKTFTIMDGTVRAQMDSGKNAGRSYPLLCFTGGADGSTINLTNVNTYGGAFIYGYSAKNTIVNVQGGTHVIDNLGSGCDSTWIGLRGNSTVTISNANFIVTDPSASIASSAHFKQNTDGATDGLGSTFTFEGCTIVSPYQSIIKYASTYSKFYFTNCNIDGIINPTLHSSDKDTATSTAYAAMPASNVIFGLDTRFTNGQFFDGTFYTATLTMEEGLSNVDEAFTKEITYTPYGEGATKITLNFEKVITDPSLTTLRWHYLDGSIVIERYNSGAGIEVFHPYTVPESTQNGWVDISYDGGWSTTPFGTKLDGLTVGSEAIDLYPSSTASKAYISSSLYNLSLYGNLELNVYLTNDMIGVTDISVTVGGAAVEHREMNNVYVNGHYYDLYIAGRIGATNLSDSITVTVSFKFIDGSFEQSFTLSPANYLYKVMDSSSTNADAKILLADMIRYSYLITQYTETPDETVTALYEKYSSYCSSLGTFTEGAADAEQTITSTYIKSITFNISKDSPSYRIYFADGLRVTNVEFYFRNAWLNDGREGGEDGVTVHRGTAAYSSAKIVADSSGNYYAESEEIPIYNLDREVELAVTFVDPNGARQTVRGIYDLDTYYNGMTDTDETKLANAKTFLQALRAYSTSAAAYRFGEKNLGGAMVSNVKNIYYEDFMTEEQITAAINGTEVEMFDALYLAHTEANALKDSGYDVKVYAIKPDGRFASLAPTFYIKDTVYSETGCTITIRTDTDWTGASFVINDKELINTDTAFTRPVFTVSNDENKVSYTPTGSEQIIAGQEYINYFKENPLGYPAFVKARDNNHKTYVRFGLNASAAYHEEVFLIDENGKLDESTPALLDFYGVTYFDVYRADQDPITIEGGDFKEYYNQCNSYSYVMRGIKINRSNTTVKNVAHTFVYDTVNDAVYASGNTYPLTGGTEQEPIASMVGKYYMGSPNNGFFSVQNANNVAILGCEFDGTRQFYEPNGNLRGSYIINASTSNNLSIRNCYQRDWNRNTDSNIYVDHQGVMGSNTCKNFLFENNYMATFDAHTAVHNLVIRGCNMERINLIGGGSAYIENTTIHTGNSGVAVILREDYGAHYAGDITFKNVTLEIYDKNAVALIGIAYYNQNTGLNYGLESDNALYSWWGSSRISGVATCSTHTDDDSDKNCDVCSATNYTDTYWAQNTDDESSGHYYGSEMPHNVTVDGLSISKGKAVKNEDGSYTYESNVLASNEGITVALATSYSGNQVHEYTCDISVYGAVDSTKGTILHPYKPTETFVVSNVKGATVVLYYDSAYSGDTPEFLTHTVLTNNDETTD